MSEGLYYWDYSGAFCALACLRSAFSETSKALKVGKLERVQRGLAESRYWVEQIRTRRTVARNHRGYVAPLPEILTPSELKLIERTGRCR